jgi:hypothetical protein
MPLLIAKKMPIETDHQKSIFLGKMWPISGKEAKRDLPAQENGTYKSYNFVLLDHAKYIIVR